MKPNNKPLYVHKMSNHPKNITANLPSMIQSRLVDISSNEEMFNQEVPTYNQAIKEAGYDIGGLKYEKPAPRKSRRLRKVNWFNPPFFKTMSSDLTKMFNALMEKHFPKSHDFHKLINKNNTKISYCTTPNIAMIIAGHNKKPIKEHNDKMNNQNVVVRTCNNHRGRPCPVQGKCLTQDVLYKATVTADEEPSMEYFGITATDFMTRYRNHTSSFRNEAYSQSTTLSSYFWKMKEQGKNPSVSFMIARVVPSFTPESGRCALCTAEKLAILKSDKNRTINKRSEIMAVCRHRRKYILQYQK